MDTIDEQLLAALGEDGRMSHRALAHRVGISESAVATRLRSLFAHNVARVIGQRRVLKDPNMAVTAILQLHLKGPQDAEAALRTLAAMGNVFIAYETARRPEICAYVQASDFADLEETVLSLAEATPGIIQLDVLPILSAHRMRRRIVSLEHAPPPRPTPQTVDEALVQVLEIDGRCPIRALARKVGLSETAARYRLEKLLAGETLEIGLVIDARRIGYSIWADIRITLQPSQVRSAIDSLSKHPDVILVMHLSGTTNLMVFIVARSVDNLDAFVRDQVRLQPGLQDYAIMRVPKVLKYDYNLTLA